MTSIDTQPQGFSSGIKFILVALTVALLIAVYLGIQVQGDTQVGLTLNTQPGLQDGLVGHWSMDSVHVDLNQNTAEIRDTSGSGLHGNWINHSSTTKPGRLGQAIDLDGVDDRIDIGDELDLIGSSLTLAAWVKPRSLSTFAGIIDKLQAGGTGNYRLTVDSAFSDEFSFGIRNTAGSFEAFRTTGSPLQIGEWVHIVATFDDNATGRMYVDGVFNSEKTDFSITRGDTTEILQLGQTNANSIYFDGLIDDARIYNRILSDDEIERLYKLGATSKLNKTLSVQPTLDDGLVGHWSMDGNNIDLGSSTREIIDSSGSEHHGNWDDHASTTRVGRVGQALRFDGSNDIVRITGSGAVSHPLDFTSGPFSMGGWFRLAGANGTILGKRDGGTSARQYQLYVILHSGSLRLIFAAASESVFAADTVIATDEWYHGFVVVDDAGNPQLYINGVAETTSNQVGSPPFVFTHNDAPVSIGARYNGFPTIGFPFEGDLDDIRIYDRALSDAEVQNIYLLGATSKVNKTLTTQPSIENGLVGHWTMDGTLVNAVGETVTDRISGVASDWDNSNDEVKPGRIGQAIRFEGGTDRVTISNANDLNIDTYSNWTMTAWVKPETFAGLGNPTIYSYCTLIASIGLSEATSGTDGRIEHWRNNSTSILSDTAVPLNEWSHVAVVYNDGGTTYFYLNGEADGSGASVSINSSTVGSGIGGTPTGTATGGFQGLIDDVRVYDRALSADEIQQIYQLGK